MENKTAIFCTSNNIYIPKCCVALLSVKKFNPEYDFYVFTSSISNDHAQLCDRLNIKYIILDLQAYFYQEWRYPRECFYHFKCPELLYNMGYKYSIFIDGDIYCNNKIEIEWSSLCHIGGVSYTSCETFLKNIDDFEYIKKVFDITIDIHSQNHIQAGVIFYNNKNLIDFDFFNKMVYLYNTSIINNCPRKGDDSLIALGILYYIGLNVKYFPKKYNFIVRNDNNINMPYHTGHQQLINSCVFFHCIKYKPWNPDPTNNLNVSKISQTIQVYPLYIYKYFVEKWREVMINEFKQSEIKSFFPIFYKNIKKSKDVLFYWFLAPIPNFGDCITPYIVNKICNFEPEKSINPITNKDSIVLMATGSIMRLSNVNTFIWGSGIRDIKQNIKASKLIRAVRGPLTRKRLLEINCECPPIYGDPGLILPLIYSPIVEKIYSLGFMPHISQYSKVYNMYKDEKDIIIIDLRTSDIESVINKMLTCKKIVSSSLHGIIVSNAYDIPVKWIKYDDNIQGDDTKYYDYFNSIDRPNETFINAVGYKKLSINVLLNKTNSYKIKFNINKFIDSSFFDLKKNIIKKYIRYQL